jgi:hypothetical protein
MLDLDAPISPGKCAAGLRVGTRVSDLPAEVLAQFTIERRVNACLPNAVLTLYHSDAVTLYVENRIIDTIQVHGGYRGTLGEGIGLGSTVAEIEERLGIVEEHEDACLMLRGVQGLRLVVACRRGERESAGAFVRWRAPIQCISVYRV